MELASGGLSECWLTSLEMRATLQYGKHPSQTLSHDNED